MIAHEDLNIKELAKTWLSKSILDAGWSEFLSIVTVKAESAGRITVAVNPSGTTQRCSGCDTVVPKTLADRWHSCSCGVELDRDVNAALNIKKLALGHRVSKARGVRRSTGTLRCEKPALYRSAIRVGSMSQADQLWTRKLSGLQCC